MDVTGTYAYNGHQGSSYANPHAVTAIGSTAYTYDRNGNLLTVATSTSHTWDYRNRLVQTVVGSATSTYAYDHTGQRVRMVTESKTFTYPSKYYSLEGSDKVKHIYAGTLLVATIRTVGSTTAASYDHQDHLGSTGVTTDDFGTIAELVDYYPYGSQRFDEKPAGTTEQRKFIGERFDEGTGLSYLNARYYNPTVGRFTGQDPVFLSLGTDLKPFGKDQIEILTNPQELNSYSYALNNPLVFSDPSGNAASYPRGTYLYGFEQYRRAFQRFGSWLGNQLRSNVTNEQAVQKTTEGVRQGELYVGTTAEGQDQYANLAGMVAGVVGPAGGGATPKVAKGLRIGEKISGLGKVIENGPGQITDITVHATERFLQRSGLTVENLMRTVKDPLVRLDQGGGRTGYLSRDAFVVLSKSGTVITWYSKNEFYPKVIDLLSRITK